MKKHSKTWWIRGVFFALPLCVVAWFIASAFITNPIRAHIARQRILEVDSHDLLMACREMMGNYEQYTNHWPRSFRDKDTCGENLPEIIRNIDPQNIFISSNRVIVVVHVPPRTGFIGYAEGVDGEELDMLNRNGTTELTNGLWMFTN